MFQSLENMIFSPGIPINKVIYASQKDIKLLEVTPDW